MGLSHIEYSFLAAAHQMGILPQGGSILEIGEARAFLKLIDAVNNNVIALTPERRNTLFAAAADYKSRIKDHPRHHELMGFFVAKKIYEVLFSYSRIVSLDYSGSDSAVKVDLNQPLSLGETFDVCINCGTTEHIFNQYQVFRTIHEHTAPNGLMIHWQPVHGFRHINHGMYLPQPGLFYDLAHANGYAVKLAALGNGGKMDAVVSPWLDGDLIRSHYGDQDTFFFIILQKTRDEPFAIPQQYESRTDREALAASWEDLHQDLL